MKRLALVLGLVILMSGCTLSQQLQFWAAKTQVEATEDPADDAALKAGVEAYLATKAAATEGRPCAQWYDYAIEAGFTPEQWMEPVSRIMYRESHCNPNADNPESSALGLMQHLRFWADRCGISYEALTDPATSLRCAFVTYQQQGWQAWVTY